MIFSAVLKLDHGKSVAFYGWSSHIVIVDSELSDKYKLITGDPVRHRIFQAIAERLGVSGWEVAKRAGMNPDLVVPALNDLSNAGIVKSTGPGLDGNYGLTGLGFALREQVVAGTRSRL